MELHEALDLIGRYGFTLIFATWALFRLDRFLMKLVENEAHEAVIQQEMLHAIDRQTELLNLMRSMK
jgi:hypothetical protein